MIADFEAAVKCVRLLRYTSKWSRDEEVHCIALNKLFQLFFDNPT